MLRDTLTNVVEAVRLEAKLSSNTSRGVDDREHIVQLIKRHYAMLAEDYDWEHLQLKRDSTTARKTMEAGSRYYDWPATINPLKITKAWVKWGNIFLPMFYGIAFDSYNSIDSDTNTNRRDPVTHWDFYGGDQFEVFPIPATDGADAGYQVAFEGQKAVEALTADTSRLDMDNHVVTLFVAGEILMENGKEKSAQLKLSAATDRLRTLRANLSDKRRIQIGLGGRLNASQWPRHPLYIRPAGG